MKASLICFLLVGLDTAFSSTAALPQPADATQSPPIANRPEKLSFSPLVYEPPVPANYRVKLNSGPVAYVVPDRELPLISIVVYVRTGDYLEPGGKEGLAETTGFLLARGGTQSKTAEELE